MFSECSCLVIWSVHGLMNAVEPPTTICTDQRHRRIECRYGMSFRMFERDRKVKVRRVSAVRGVTDALQRAKIECEV